MENTSWHSYGSIYNIGHRALVPLFDNPVTIEEKVDGSQISFGVFDGVVRVRSRNQEFPVDAPDKMFDKAVESILSRKDVLVDGWTYRGEYLNKPKHNTLTYGRVPEGNIIIFDVATAEETYLGYHEKLAEANRIGLECVPLIFEGKFSGDAETFRALIDRESILGEAKIEGVVIKNYSQFAPDKKVLMGKHVSEAFREVHNKEWKKSNPTGKDIIQHIGDRLRAEGRWKKTIQRLRDDGKLTGTPADIGPLLKELHSDIDKECKEIVVEELMKWGYANIKKHASYGFAEWYKQKLLDVQFGEDDGA